MRRMLIILAVVGLLGGARAYSAATEKAACTVQACDPSDCDPKDCSPCPLPCAGDNR